MLYYVINRLINRLLSKANFNFNILVFSGNKGRIAYIKNILGRIVKSLSLWVYRSSNLLVLNNSA